MYFAPMDENLTILPSHRVLDRRVDMDRVKLEFDVSEPTSEYMAVSSITMYHRGTYYSLEVKDQKSLSDIIVLHTMLGAHRVLDMLTGAQLPRIC